MLKNTDILVVDCDGVLTDGMYSVSSNGVITKNFYTRDFSALEKIQQLGVKVVILTQSEDDCLKYKINSLKNHEDISFFCGIKNKLQVVTKLVLEKGCTWGQCAYMGDSQNDYECMCYCNSACPCDAEKPILKIAKYVSPYKGGHGAVADFIEHLLENDK